MNPRSILVFYYAATAIFLLLDHLFNINVRLAFLESHPALRAAYYGFCFLCLALMLWRPAWTVIVGAFESLITLIALIFTMALRTMIVTDKMVETGAGIVSPSEIVNFVISGGAAYVAWVRGLNDLRGQKFPNY